VYKKICINVGSEFVKRTKVSFLLPSHHHINAHSNFALETDKERFLNKDCVLFFNFNSSFSFLILFKEIAFILPDISRCINLSFAFVEIVIFFNQHDAVLLEMIRDLEISFRE